MTLLHAAPRRFAGLDGLRAVAVILVLAYHLFPSSPVRSGFVGVDVFFVISGFLITSLLLRQSRLGRLGSPRRLIDFWRRRARRLLPALAVVITVCATAAWMLGGDVLVGVGRQVLGAATFSYNWLAVADGSDYFAATAPELFRNVWSLAVEEQFYVLWPLLLPLVLLIPGRWTRTALMLVAAGGSVWWMAVLVAQGDVTRAYFGTDSHAFGLLLGIALALATVNMPERAWMLRRGAQVGSLFLGFIGLSAVLVAALSPEDASITGVLVLASLGTALTIFAGNWPSSWLGRGLDVAPLRWIGERSYGIYLWHWPVLVLALVATQGTGPEAGVPLGTGAVALVVSVGAAALSYRFVEQPLRRYGFRRTARAVRSRIVGRPMARLAGVSVLVVGAVAVGGTAAAIVTAPPITSAEAAIAAGEQAMKDAAKAAPDPSDEEPEPIDVPDGAEITAVGDSVMLASAPSLYTQFPGITVDAEVSRSIWAGPDILGDLASRGELRENVVVALGTNGPVDWGVLEEMSQVAGKDRNLILVNAHAPRDWIPGVNADLDAFADSHRSVWVADWSGAIAPHTELLAGDDIHPGEAGGEVFADSVETALECVEKDRIHAEKDFERAPSGRAPRVPFPE